MTQGACRETREHLAAFLDNELPAERCRSIQGHLDACGGCRVFLKLEQEFTQVVRARLVSAAPPGSLMKKLSSALDEEDRAAQAEPLPRPARAALRRSGGWVLAAAAMAVLLVPLMRFYAPGTYDSARMMLTGVRRSPATLVCVECDREGAPLDAQRRCHAPGHQTGLRCPETGHWHLVANETTLPLMRDRSRRGDPVIVEGRWLDDIHYVDASSVKQAAAR